MDDTKKEPRHDEASAPVRLTVSTAQEPMQGVTAKEGGAKRSSYWKDRDYQQ